MLSDDVLATRIGNAGQRKYQTRYTIDAMTSATVRLYEEVISQSG